MSMGQLIRVETRQRGLGFTPIIAAAPATGTAAPFVVAAGLIASLVPVFAKLLNFGYNPRKLNDTAITEAVKQALNQLWYQLTGEAINGVQRTADPGQYGKAGIALFAGSAYPDVPYPAGRTDPAGIIAQAQQIIAQGRSNLVRQESFQGYDANANAMLGLFSQVAQAQAAQNPLSALYAQGQALAAGQGGIAAILPWLIGGYAVYKWVL